MNSNLSIRMPAESPSSAYLMVGGVSDKQNFEIRTGRAVDFEHMIRGELNVLHDKTSDSRRVFAIPLHLYIKFFSHRTRCWRISYRT